MAEPGAPRRAGRRRGPVGDVVGLAIVGLDGLTGVVIAWQDDRHHDASRGQPLISGSRGQAHRRQVGEQANETEADYHRPVFKWLSHKWPRSPGAGHADPAERDKQPARKRFTVVQGFITSSKSVQSLHRNRQRCCPGTVTRLAFHDRFPVQTRRSPSDQSQPQSETGPARAPVRPAAQPRFGAMIKPSQYGLSRRLPVRERHHRTNHTALVAKSQPPGSLFDMSAFVHASSVFDSLQSWSGRMCPRRCQAGHVRGRNSDGAFSNDYQWTPTRAAHSDLTRILAGPTPCSC